MNYRPLCAWLCGLVLSAQCLSKPLLLGSMPLLKAEIFAHQMQPMVQGLANEGEQLKFLYPKTLREFLNLCETGQITMAYVSSGYASLLIDKFGFIPLLKSDQPLKVVLFSRKQTQQDLLLDHIYYAEQDILAAFSAKKMANKKGIHLMQKSTVDHVIYTVLEQQDSAGITVLAQLGLVNETFKNEIQVHNAQTMGSLYLLMAPQLKSRQANIQRHFYNFHKSWQAKSTSSEYHYLNHFSFIKWQSQHMDGLKVSKEFQRYLHHLSY